MAMVIYARDYEGLTIFLDQTMKELAQKGEAKGEEEQLRISQLREQRKDWSRRSLFLPSLWWTQRG